MKNKKISIIGHFGGNENILDGQTIKTKILYDELKNATDWKIKKVGAAYCCIWASLLSLSLLSCWSSGTCPRKP